MYHRLINMRFIHALCLPLAALLLAGSAWAAAPESHTLNQERNYDARIEHTKSFLMQKSIQQENALEVLKAQVSDLGVTFDAKFGTTRTLYNQTGYLTSPSLAAGEPMAVAMEYVRANLDVLGLEAADLAEYEVRDSFASKVSGATHIYLRQMHRGIPVYNAQLHINVSHDGRILSVNNAFVPGLAQAVNRAIPALAADEAVGAAALHIGIASKALPQILGQGNGVQRKTEIAAEGISRETINAELMWLPIQAGEVRLVWNFQLQTLDDQHWFDMTVDADSGQIWTRFDWTNSGTYRVFEEPDESPLHGSQSRSLVVNPEDSTASPNGWFTGGTMDGNNVHACPDANANNSCDSNPQCSGTTCDFSLNLNQAPANSLGAAVSNLFYWNNLIHDVQYQYGFTESAGNFQENNFGRGGSGSDSVNADAQDGSGNCNANFSTPTDGGNPRMQMFTCNRASPARDGDYDNGVIVHEYGHGISIRQVGGRLNSSCLNNSQQAGEGWSDWFGLAYTAEAGDAGSNARGIGSYLFNETPEGGTIRDLPYSTNNSINNWTYSSIGGAGIPHGIGSRWAQAIWEVYWALVAKHGFSAGDQLLNPAAGGWDGSERAMLYINEGLQNTACSPTFINNRDGIIQAAQANFGGEDVCDIWEAFAAFGLGTNASTGGSNSTTASNGFNVPASCSGPPPPSSCPAGSLDFNSLSLTSYSNQNASNQSSVLDGGDTLNMTGNTWLRTTQTFNITSDTVVEFLYASTDQGEIHAIGFDPDDTLNNQAAHFQIWGTQNWTGTGNVGRTSQQYSGSGNFESFSIPVGQTYTGNRFLVFTNDNDSGSGNGNFSCVRIFEDGGGPGGNCTVDDDFESGSATGWFNDGASTCTTGAYTLGNPTAQSSGGVTTQPSGSNSGVFSIFSATNTSAGNADVDNGNCILGSPTWSVSAASTLSVSSFHGQRDNGDDPGDDFFLLEYSLNGGSSWNTLRSNGDSISTASWATSTTQIPAGSNVALRVQCSDGSGPGDIIECGIDDVSICDN